MSRTGWREPESARLLPFRYDGGVRRNLAAKPVTSRHGRDTPGHDERERAWPPDPSPYIPHRRNARERDIPGRNGEGAGRSTDLSLYSPYPDVYMAWHGYPCLYQSGGAGGLRRPGAAREEGRWRCTSGSTPCSTAGQSRLSQSCSRTP